jgi:hypothetical protein
MAFKLRVEAVNRLCIDCEPGGPSATHPLIGGAQKLHKVGKGPPDNLMANEVPTTRDESRMKIRKAFAALALIVVLPLGAAACSTDTTASATTNTSTTTTSDSAANGAPAGGPGGVDVSSVSTEEQLIALVQDAYGDASLDRHRGHQPVQDVLNTVLAISHEELHVRMEAGANLAAVATDLGLDPQTLIDALVTSWSPAIDNVLATGAITEAEAEQYRAALKEAFTFRVTWNGTDATPTFTGLTA